MKLLLALASAFASAYCSAELNLLSDFAKELGVVVPAGNEEGKFVTFVDDMLNAIHKRQIFGKIVGDQHEPKLTQAVSVLETSFNDFIKYSRNFDYTKALTAKTKKIVNAKINLAEAKHHLLTALIDILKIVKKVPELENLLKFKFQLDIPISTIHEFVRELNVPEPTTEDPEVWGVFLETLGKEIGLASKKSINKYENVLIEYVDSVDDFDDLDEEITKAEESFDSLSHFKKAEIEKKKKYLVGFKKFLTEINARLGRRDSGTISKLRELINRIENLKPEIRAFAGELTVQVPTLTSVDSEEYVTFIDKLTTALQKATLIPKGAMTFHNYLSNRMPSDTDMNLISYRNPVPTEEYIKYIKRLAVEYKLLTVLKTKLKIVDSPEDAFLTKFAFALKAAQQKIDFFSFAKELGVKVPRSEISEEWSVFYEALATQTASATPDFINKYKDLLTELADYSDEEITQAEESLASVSDDEKAVIEKMKKYLVAYERFVTAINTRLGRGDSENISKLREIISRIENLTLMNLPIRPHVI